MFTRQKLFQQITISNLGTNVATSKVLYLSIFALHLRPGNRNNKPKMAYRRNLDCHRLTWTNMDYGLTWTNMDYHGLSWTIMDYHGPS